MSKNVRLDGTIFSRQIWLHPIINGCMVRLPHHWSACWNRTRK